ncbi:winged helix-turn-helix domain-containing protein [Prevotella sp. KH2C16]|uniref:winged helix-turn-helix domain-containing protein n=1 Tax=Prevotella sp. KH2C16 TaxID=1855325 RepID=UPI0008F3C31D|nr:winged helix-turn-helix domain-containing protein [Prevotella sp. KH2C16]SFF93886.1 Winged helix-turn-helix domain [Prevotella sp. KH2C16]
MAEKKATQAAAAVKKAAPVKKEATVKAAPAKKAEAPKKAVVAKAAVALNALNVGFKAGDVYQALATAEKALTVAEIAKAAKISTEEVLLGMGWLFKEGKIKDEGAKVVLA